METEIKPSWWERYFTPYTDEHTDWYTANKSNVTNMEKTMNWQTGERMVNYSGRGFNKITFKDTF